MKARAKTRRKENPLGGQIGRTAREARLKLGWTQADVAERIGLTVEVYGRLERGQMLPSTPTLIGLRSALGVAADVLLGLTPAQATTAPPEATDELPLETRRLVRSLRGLDRLQLSIFQKLAQGLLMLNERKKRRREGGPANVT